MSHLSFKSVEETSSLFAKMFWDSNIAQIFSLSRTKFAFLTLGIAPYFEETLLKNVRAYSGCYIVIFDLLLTERLVNFWIADKVKIKYLGSRFLKSGKSEDLLKVFKQAMAGLDESNLVQLGMDGPNVNLKLQRLYADERRNIDIDIPTRFTYLKYLYASLLRFKKSSCRLIALDVFIYTYL